MSAYNHCFIIRCSNHLQCTRCISISHEYNLSMNISYTSISIGWREKPVKRIYNQDWSKAIFLSTFQSAWRVGTCSGKWLLTSPAIKGTILLSCPIQSDKTPPRKNCPLASRRAYVDTAALPLLDSPLPALTGIVLVDR